MLGALTDFRLGTPCGASFEELAFFYQRIDFHSRSNCPLRLTSVAGGDRQQIFN